MRTVVVIGCDQTPPEDLSSELGFNKEKVDLRAQLVHSMLKLCLAAAFGAASASVVTAYALGFFKDDPKNLDDLLDPSICDNYDRPLVDSIAEERTLAGRSSALIFPKDCKGRVIAEIDLSAISHNVSHIQKMAAETNCKVIGVLKADAYGHGAAMVAQTLVAANRIDFFAVATVSEGIEIRQSVPADTRVLVLGATDPSEWPAYSKYRLDMMINSGEMAAALLEWAAAARAKGALHDPIRVHVMLNTGMSRIGLETFSYEDPAMPAPAAADGTETKRRSAWDVVRNTSSCRAPAGRRCTTACRRRRRRRWSLASRGAAGRRSSSPASARTCATRRRNPPTR